jgi:hypothetical protein
MTTNFDFSRQERDPLAGNTRAVTRPQLHLLLLALGIAVAAVVVVWLLTTGGSSGTQKANNGPAIVSQAQLVRFANSLDYRVFWTRPHAGYTYELTSAKGRVWVRYLTASVKAGDPRAGFLVVGTYEQPRAYSDLKRAAKQPGTVSKPIADGGLLVYNAQRPTSVYFSYPGATYEVEVYAPSARTALSLVLNGKITAVQ